MSLIFVLIAGLILLSGIGAMAFRNLIHCSLCLVLTFTGLGVLYLRLGAEFVGLVQLLVYVGAVAILIVFAILLTRGGGEGRRSGSWPARLAGIGCAVLVFASLAGAITTSAIPDRLAPVQPDLTVRQVGERLLSDHVLALEVIGLLLTAALIGAVVIAWNESDALDLTDSQSAGSPRPGGEEAPS